MSALDNPHEALSACGNNPWLSGGVDRIAGEIARTKFHLQIENDEGEIEIVKRHDALDTMARPQPTKGGKSMLSGMQLKLVTGYHLCLARRSLLASRRPEEDQRLANEY